MLRANAYSDALYLQVTYNRFDGYFLNTFTITPADTITDNAGSAVYHVNRNVTFTFQPSSAKDTDRFMIYGELFTSWAELGYPYINSIVPNSYETVTPGPCSGLGCCGGNSLSALAQGPNYSCYWPIFTLESTFSVTATVYQAGVFNQSVTFNPWIMPFSEFTAPGQNPNRSAILNSQMQVPGSNLTNQFSQWLGYDATPSVLQSVLNATNCTWMYNQNITHNPGKLSEWIQIGRVYLTKGPPADARNFFPRISQFNWPPGSRNGTMYITLQNNGSITSTEVMIVAQPDVNTACCVYQKGNCTQGPTSVVITGDNDMSDTGWMTAPAHGTLTIGFYLLLSGPNTGQTGTCNFTGFCNFVRTR
ncbi:hypothetical protein WJX81_007507 [Elliptochloris bilobata]|uniref:Uncharacterized protein n=1 Tax=Elliptochloris bilobata TaxID=381761 RepID=A0AAW1S9Y0_9CHLO